MQSPLFCSRSCKTKKLTEFFLVLFFAFSALTQYGPELPFIGTTIQQILGKIQFQFTLGLSGYYVLGCYLKKYPLSGKKEIALYALGIVMPLLTGAATVWNTLRGVAGKEWFSKYLMPNVILEAAAIYSFFVNRVSRLSFSGKAEQWITRLSEYSFGVYLVHALVLEILAVIMKDAVSKNWFVAISMSVLMTFAVSNLLVWAIRKIPRVGKRIT